MRIVITGGAGFLGSHLCEAFVSRGDSVVCVDSLITGSMANVATLVSNPAFEFIEQNVSDALRVDGDVDAVLHFASPASPKAYLANPLITLKVGSYGTFNSLDLAREHDARFMIASTSEVYGDPEIHPQPESYWGKVNPNGFRSVYDEAKRFSEAATASYHREFGVNTAIVRFFNTYGPHMAVDDGRVVSNFICQALQGEPITIYGNGAQTRSFGYVSDSVAGVLALLDSTESDPVNIGNPGEFTMLELAQLVIELTDSTSEVVYEPLPLDDPQQRRPDITRAREVLGWEPTVSLREGLEPTIAYFRKQLIASAALSNPL